MPRISYIDDSKKTAQVTALIDSAQKTGAPDPRVVSIMTRSEVGTAWVECWNKVLYKGVLPHKLKEMCRNQDLSRAPVRLLFNRSIQRG
jgi:hypothetical protein